MSDPWSRGHSLDGWGGRGCARAAGLALQRGERKRDREPKGGVQLEAQLGAEAQRAQHEEIERICRVGVKEYQKTADTVRRGAPRPKGSKRRTASDCGHCALRPPKPAVYHCYGPPTAVISCLYAYPPNTSAPPQHLLVASLSAAACLPLRQVPLPGAFSSSSCAYAVPPALYTAITPYARTCRCGRSFGKRSSRSIGSNASAWYVLAREGAMCAGAERSC